MNAAPKILFAENLSQYKKLIHGFTTKELSRDYDRIAQELKILPSQIYSLKQVHSSHVVYFGQDMDLADIPEGDAIVTDRKDVVIGVKTADCVPILVYDEVYDVLAAIHAGYKGMLAGVIQKTIAMMVNQFSCHPTKMTAAIGPCISVDHYEVGDDVITLFEEEFGNLTVYQAFPASRPHLDLSGTTAHVLQRIGLPAEHIEILPYCTFERDDLFHSYRRQNGLKQGLDHCSGRQFNFIGLVS